MVYALCNKEMTEDAIEQSYQVLSSLQCIVIDLLAEQAQSNRAVRKRKYRLRKKPVNSFEYFLSKSIMCLDMANNFHEWNRKSRAMFGLLMQNMDIYNRLRKELERIMYNVDQLDDEEMIYDKNFIIIPESDLIYDEIGECVNADITQLLEFEEYEISEFYNWVHKVSEREGLLIGIEAKFNEIQDIFFKRCFSLYRELNDYCKKLRQYLCSNKHNLKSCKFYREINLAQYVCCKYHFLKRLLERVGEEEKHIAKYDAAFKGNRWRSSDDKCSSL